MTGPNLCRKRKIPLWEPFPQGYPVLTYDDMLTSKSMLDEGMKHVFRHFVSVEVKPWIDGLGNHVYKVDIVALNQSSIWRQHIIIGDTMTLTVYGGQIQAAWVHNRNYYNKIMRVISHWLATTAEYKMGLERQKIRMATLKAELISRTGCLL